MKITKKIIYKIEFNLASALAIGSGDNYVTDKDIILGSDMRPYIPASTIAGVCINALRNKKKEYREYWGYIIKETAREEESKEELKEKKSKESSIVFYNAIMAEKDAEPVISVRDSVTLDEYKTAKKGQKFDMEVLEPGIKFVTYVEQSFDKNTELDIAKVIADCFASKNIYFGAKTSRGYGAIDDVKISYSEISFEKPYENLLIWVNESIEDLPWKLYTNNCQNESIIPKEKIIKIRLRQEGGISIRKYTTIAPATDKEIVPNYMQLVTSKGKENKQLPVIPGTSWAGAFQAQIKSHLKGAYDEEKWKNIFGFVENKKRQKSKIRFSETIIEGATPKQLSRNAIDRFTGGTVDGALFTELTYYGGETDLSIGFSEDLELTDEFAKAFAAAIVDLHYGFMAVGGETSIGRGLFSIMDIKCNSCENDSSIELPLLYEIDSANDFYRKVYGMVQKSAKKGDDDCGE